jgi:carotenoid cleavage dioxygenase-like enzyme
LLGIHRGVLYAVRVHHDRELSYRSHRILPDGSTDRAAHEFAVVGGSILAFGHGTLAQQLSPDLGELTPVDLAGRSRPLAACPRRDPINGDVHLLATERDGSQAHVVVSSGALTRRNRPIVDPPNRVHDLAIAGDHVLFAADGFLGIGARDRETDVHWITTGIETPELVHAYAGDDDIVVVILTPSLERWAIRPESMSIDREVLDPAPQRRARIHHHLSGSVQPFLWTIGDRTVGTYDLVSGRHVTRRFDDGRPGDLAFVNDPVGPHDTHGGWLLGFVHDASVRHSELVLLDAADIAGPLVASADVPGRIPLELRTAWIPETSHPPRQGARS